MNNRKAHIVLFLTCGFLLSEHFLFACGSMGRDAGAKILTFVGMLLLLPMLPLILIELAILKFVGNLGSKTLSAYCYCLVAKVLAFMVAAFCAAKGLGREVVVAEAIYSTVHFGVSLYILMSVFKAYGQNQFITAILISTVIPWAYSASVYFLGRMDW